MELHSQNRLVSHLEMLCIADLQDEHCTATGQNSERQPEDGAEAASDREEDEDRPPAIDTYSDISDSEVDGMILSEAESQSRRKVWEQMNADWLEKQEAREASRKQLEALQVHCDCCESADDQVLFSHS